MVLLLIQSDFFRFLVSDSSMKNWEETALSWFFTVLFVAIIWTILMILIKLGIKSSASTVKDKIWERSRTWGWIFLGFLPIALTLLIFWYLSEDFLKVVYTGGLVKGILIGWILHFIISLLANLTVRSWRNEM